MTQEDVQYIDEVYNKKDTGFKPDVKRVVRIYNEVMPDGMHIFRKLNENMCACNLRPHLINLWRKMDANGMFVKPATKSRKKNGGNKK